ncbi:MULTISPECIES: hypothetical protein [unclassified Frankia]|uniref:hypothetical protein n=1 Tax=unclassified Frankia TaxID=2632575 RepID=UPI0020244BD1
MSATDVITSPLGGGADTNRSALAQAERRSMSRNSQLLVAWCGPAMFVLFVIGSVWLARYFPPAIHPNDSAQEVAQYYRDHKDAIRVGLVFTCLAYALMGVWGVCMAVQTRRKEGLFPVLTYVQLTCMAAGTAQIVVNCGLWATAAFRPGETSPEITQAFNDAGFIILLGTWMPFTIWAIALGLNILLDRTTPVFPRWTGYFSIWSGVCFMPGGTVWFFKSGPFGWTGVVCLWVPFVVFGAWVLYFSYLSMQNVRRGFVHEQDLAAVS